MLIRLGFYSFMRFLEANKFYKHEILVKMNPVVCKNCLLHIYFSIWIFFDRLFYIYLKKARSYSDLFLVNNVNYYFE